MASFTQLNYHIVFGTKYRRGTITDDVRERLYEYVGGTIRAIKGHLAEIGGVADHVHMLARLPPTLALSDVVRDMKANSSKWLSETSPAHRSFEWQKGYSAFTVSYSQIDVVRQYIQSQQEHHKTVTFQDEYIAFLKRHGIEFQLEYLFEDEHHG